MKVSFIIPLYNCLPYTRECLRTLTASLPRGLDHEIILIDDGSTDGTREWLARECSQHHVILNDQNLGYAASNNRAISRASGDQLVLINNDLFFAPGWLEPMFALQSRLRRPGLIGNLQYDARTGALDHAGIFFDHKGKPGHDRSFPLRHFVSHGYRIAPAVTGACMLVSAQLWREAGGFEEGYRNGGEDIDLCLKVRQFGRVNAVSLRSAVRHHVSASPGRKAHNEQNSQRLTLRWRDEIASLSSRAWCGHFLATTWGCSREPGKTGEALALLAYHLRLRSTPPSAVSRGINAALIHELKRWDRLFHT